MGKTISCTAQKNKFSIKVSSVNVNESSGNCDLVTFTEEVLNGKHHFLRSAPLFPR